MTKHMLRRSAQDELPRSRMAIGSHDEKVGSGRRDVFGEYEPCLTSVPVYLFGHRAYTVGTEMSHHILAEARAGG